MNTVKDYELTNTDKLKKLLKKYEIENEDAILNLDNEKNIDCEIDINIIRMELTKRMWFQDSI